MKTEQDQTEKHSALAADSPVEVNAVSDRSALNNDKQPSSPALPPFTASTFKRRLYVGAGYFFVGLGVLGLILPILPTTPFLLLAAGCFSRGSHRAKQWLLTHKIFGPYISAFRQGKGLTRQQKWRIGLAASATLGLSIAFAPFLAIQILCGSIWVGLLFFLSTSRTNRKNTSN